MSGSSKRKLRPNEMRLIPLKPKAGYKSEIVYNFERVNPKTGERESDIPLLNFDSPPWIPGILVGHERDIAETNPQLLKGNFFAKMNQDEEEEAGLLLLPRPGKKATWCGVCDDTYQDYYTHITSHEHQTKLSNNTFLGQIAEETNAIQQDFQNHVLPEINFEEISSKETFAPNNDSKSGLAGVQEIIYNKSENKENVDPETSEKKEIRSMRRLKPIMNDDDKEQPNETISTNTGRQNLAMGRKIQVQKVCNVPTASQTDKMVLSGDKYHPVLEEASNGNKSLQNWMFNPQDGMKKTQNIRMDAATDVDQGESRSLKRKYPAFTYSDNEVVDHFKRVKITDENSVQEDQKTIQIPMNFVKGTFNSLMNAFSESLGNLKVRLFNQFGINR